MFNPLTPIKTKSRSVTNLISHNVFRFIFQNFIILGKSAIPVTVPQPRTENCSETPGPCQNGGTCMDTDTGYRCQCSSGITGTNCELGEYFNAASGNNSFLFLTSVCIMEINKLVVGQLYFQHQVCAMCDHITLIDHNVLTLYLGN